jgi:hypothetical protein
MNTTSRRRRPMPALALLVAFVAAALKHPEMVKLASYLP